jgi:hypothetical protein
MAASIYIIDKCPSLCPSHHLSPKWCFIERIINTKVVSLGEITWGKLFMFLLHA